MSWASPLPEEEPFAIVRRGGAELLLKEIGAGIAPLPNPVRHVNARWDAFVGAPDPDVSSWTTPIA